MPGKVFIHYVPPSAISRAYYCERMGRKSIFTQGPCTVQIYTFMRLLLFTHIQ